MEKRIGYIAISRGIFDHPLFKSKKPFAAREAWAWLIHAAAWKPRGEPNRFGVIHEERGQFSVTRRELAAQWNWSKSKVDRFLRRLERESMIVLDRALNGPKNRPENAPIIGYPRTMITLCNYEKFQGATLRRSGQRANQKAGQNGPELPGLIYAVASQPINQAKQRKLESSEGRINRKRPPHGKIWNGMIFVYYGTSDWADYAADYRNVRGCDLMPKAYLDGRGRWFVSDGEANRRDNEQVG